MDFGQIVKWAEAHPTETIIIGAGGLIALLWALGYIGGGQAAPSGDTGTANMAAAYYAAEQAQAVVGGQIQVATIQAAAATAMNASNNTAAVAIDQTNASAAQTINQQNVGGAIELGNQNLNATYSNNNAAVQVAASNANAATQIAATQMAAQNELARIAGNVAEFNAQSQVQIAQAQNKGFFSSIFS
jgi:hypothetical protein